MATQLKLAALAITREILKDQLYDWIMRITAATGSIPFITGIGPFDTVARASSARMLDATEAGLADTPNGTEVWVESFGGGVWTWRTDFPAATATDNEKKCRPTAWIATGLPGAFVRNIEGEQTARNQAAWFVNSTAADNEGAGTSLDPVQSDDEISRRWGPSPALALAVTINYAQAPTLTTNFNQVGFLDGGSLTINGTPTISKAGTVLTAVQIQVRTAGSELGWAVTGAGLGAADVGKLLVITQSGTGANVGAYAAILKDETGGKVRVSPFGTSSPTAFTTVTPQVGDVVEVHDGMVLKCGGIEFVMLTQTGATTGPLGQAVLFNEIKLSGNGTGHVYSKRVPVFYQRCQYDNLSFASVANQLSTQTHRLNGGCIQTGGLAVTIRGFVQFNQVGSLGSVTVFTGSRLTLSSDCYFQNNILSTAAGSTVLSSGVAFFDRATSDNALSVGNGSCFIQSGAVPDWGTANAGHGTVVRAAGSYVYGTKPTINGTLGAGREALIGGTDKLYAAVPYVEGANGAALVLSA